MEKEFIPYEEALALKELGFNQPCVGAYHDNSGGKIEFTFGMFQYPKYNSKVNTVEGTHIGKKGCYAPLYQQAFRWFRDEYKKKVGLDYRMRGDDNIEWYYVIRSIQTNGDAFISAVADGGFDAYEEVELACLKKLIEIVKDGDIKETT